MFIALVVSMALSGSTPLAWQNGFQQQLAAAQGNVKAIHEVAENAQQQQRRSDAVRYFQQALAAGHAESAFALMELVPTRRAEWLSRAAQLGHEGARLRLLHAKWTGSALDLGEIDNEWVLSHKQKAKLNEEERALYAELLLIQGEPPSATHWRALAPATPNWQKLRRGSDLFRATPEQCDFRLYFQLERTQALPSMYRWVAELDAFLQTRGAQLCVARSVDYLMSCPRDGTRAYCQYHRPFRTDSVNVVVTRQGSANTRNRNIFIPEQANWRVLFHEIGHALGLADEYPMQRDVAERFCAGDFRFPSFNIVTTELNLLSDGQMEAFKDNLPWREYLTTDIAQPVRIGGVRYWRLGSSEPREVGLYPAATCENTAFQAWRPIDRATFMERSEYPYVPELYLKWMYLAHP